MKYNIHPLIIFPCGWLHRLLIEIPDEFLFL